MPRKSTDAPMSFFAFQAVMACVTGVLVIITLMLSLELIGRDEAKKAGEVPPEQAKLQETLVKALAEQKRLQAEIAKLETILASVNDKMSATPEDVEALLAKIKDLDKKLELLEAQLQELEDERQELEIVKSGLQRSSGKAQQELEEVMEELKIERDKPDIPSPGGNLSGMEPIYVDVLPKSFDIYQTLPTGKLYKVRSFAGEKAEEIFLDWAVKRSKRKYYFVLLAREESVPIFQKVRRELRIKRFKVSWDAWAEDQRLIKGGR